MLLATRFSNVFHYRSLISLKLHRKTSHQFTKSTHFFEDDSNSSITDRSMQTATTIARARLLDEEPPPVDARVAFPSRSNSRLHESEKKDHGHELNLQVWYSSILSNSQGPAQTVLRPSRHHSLTRTQETRPDRSWGPACGTEQRESSGLCKPFKGISDHGMR